MVVLAVTVAVAMSFATGEAFRPVIWLSLFWGALAGLGYVMLPSRRGASASIALVIVAAIYVGVGPILIGESVGEIAAGPWRAWPGAAVCLVDRADHRGSAVRRADAA